MDQSRMASDIHTVYTVEYDSNNCGIDFVKHVTVLLSMCVHMCDQKLHLRHS